MANPTVTRPYQNLLYELADGVLTLTLNRPERLNAFNDDLMYELFDAFDRADEDDQVRAIIMTGAGRGFCAGADLGPGGNTFNKDVEGDRDEFATEGDQGGRVSRRLYDCNKPTIAAINGPAVGVGITMTLPMDFRLASERARIGFVFARRGIVPEACSSFFLPRVVGIQQALEWSMTGRVFDAEEALRGRLVRSVHPAEELLPAARALAREIADNTAPVSITLIRHMMWRMMEASDPVEAHRLDSQAIKATGSMPDATEGVESFLEKRPAAFTGRPSKDLPDFFPWWDQPSFRKP